MAIVIPSSKTYERQNPKVRDNVIERIEVGAIEVVSDNDYETPVYNETIESGIEFYNSTISDNLFSQVTITGYAKEFWYAYHWISPQYIKNISIKIPKIKNNKWANKIYTGVKEDKENKSEEISYIGVTIRATKETGTATGTYPLSGKPTTNYTKTEDYTGSINPKKTYTYTHTISGSLASKSVTTPEKWVNEDNINTANYTDNNDYYYLNLTILCGYEEIGVGGYNSYGDPSMQTPTNISLSGECEKYTAYRVEITIYGNTIGIDLTDKTVYIPETDKTSKKVHSIEGNELMQTSNYIYQDETEINAIDKMYDNTRKAYENGKETATIRCSIGDYYFYNETKQNGKRDLAVTVNQNKVQLDNNFATINVTQPSGLYEMQVSIETPLKHDLYVEVIYGNQVEINKTFVIKAGETYSSILTVGKISPTKKEIVSTYYKIPMVFKMYDEVIPMVYSSNGKDYPMSKNKDGSPKIFKVIGTKIFYDGAVWQELSLQEI